MRQGVVWQLCLPKTAWPPTSRDRLGRQRDAGALRADVPVAALAQFLELAYDGLVLHLAMGRPAKDLGRVLDLIEGTVRRAR
ncbi:hypothetical protein GCM10009557_90550 [Virgisporangium ochraceum]